MIFYVHVGKTGGTALKRQIRAHFGVKKRKEPQVVGEEIVLLNHISLDDAVRKFGQPSGIAFAFREPSARFVSGFYCRQRMGWPEHKALWDAREAAAFAHFDAANDLAEALDSDDPARRAAAYYGMSAIRHIRRGYEYHFGHLADFFLDHAEHVTACIDTCNITAHGSEFLNRIGVEATVLSGEDTAKPQVQFPRELSDRAMQNLRDHWHVEYAYYDAFKTLEALFST